MFGELFVLALLCLPLLPLFWLLGRLVRLAFFVLMGAGHVLLALLAPKGR